MSEPKVVTCPNCGQKTRVRSAAEGVPHCPKCGRPLPWLTDVGVEDFSAVVEKSPSPVMMDGGKERDRVTGAMNLNALRQWVEHRLPASSKAQSNVK